MAVPRQRLDVALVERGIVESREKARRHIMAGDVWVNDHPAIKADARVCEADVIILKGADKFVGRGAYKLEKALDDFDIQVAGLVAIDIGASTGGFTDCLLQRGATKVYAIDVGHGQLAWKLRQDSRVILREKTNARFLTPADFPDPLCFACVDVSFISLTRILPVLFGVLQPGSRWVTLVKPQFEAGKEEVDRGAGIIRDPAVHERVVQEIRIAAEKEGLKVEGVIPSPIEGADGNREFLMAGYRP